MDDQDIRTVVTRLARPYPSGGQVIERAAIVAEGADSREILAWISSHDGKPEADAPATGKPHKGLHPGRGETSGLASSVAPRRYVLPPGALA
ncbi:MAG: hypothetical protein WBQ18_14095 [Solirubrobacteraceae bacterium]